MALVKCSQCNDGICPTCNGTGSNKELNPHPSKPYVDSDNGTVTCYACMGNKSCQACNGTGYIETGEGTEVRNKY